MLEEYKGRYTLEQINSRKKCLKYFRNVRKFISSYSNKSTAHKEDFLKQNQKSKANKIVHGLTPKGLGDLSLKLLVVKGSIPGNFKSELE